MTKENERSQGRPPGTSNLRDTILQVARMQFADYGYDHTTMRSVAVEAGINPTLIVHYFSTKHKLFLESMLATTQTPAIFQTILEGASLETIGARLAKLTRTFMEKADSRATFLGLLRAAASDAEAATILQSFISTNLLPQLRQYLPVDNAALTATFISSQIVGLFVSRYITKIEPLASIDLSELEVQLAGQFQKLLV